jgi:hypothetical protein
MSSGVIFTFTEIFLVVSASLHAWKQLGTLGNLPGVFDKSLGVKSTLHIVAILTARPTILRTVTFA